MTSEQRWKRSKWKSSESKVESIRERERESERERERVHRGRMLLALEKTAEMTSYLTNKVRQTIKYNKFPALMTNFYHIRCCS